MLNLLIFFIHRINFWRALSWKYGMYELQMISLVPVAHI